jgi:hypothetical protein
MAHRRAAVQAGLEWLAAKGLLTIAQRRNSTQWTLAKGEGSAYNAALVQAQNHLDDVLAETLAYRDYWRRAPVGSLIDH